MDMTKPKIHFTNEEFADRQNRVRQELVKHELDSLLLFKIEDMYWMRGFESDGFSIFHSMFVGADGQLTHLSRTADLVNLKYSSICDDVRIAPDSANVSWASCIKDMLAAHGMRGKRIGIQVDTMGLIQKVFLEIQASLEGWCELVIAENFIQDQRRVKSPHELTYIKTARKF